MELSVFSGMKRYYPVLAVFIISIFVSACTDSDSESSEDSHFTVSFIDRGLDYPVDILVNGKNETLLPGQELKVPANKGADLQVEVSSHSPLLQCGFRDRGRKALRVVRESDRWARLDCEFIDFLSVEMVDATTNRLKRQSFISGGEVSNTQRLEQIETLISVGQFRNRLLFLAQDESETRYLWSGSQELAFRQPAWTQVDLKAVALGEDLIVLLYGDESGRGRIELAQGMESTPVLYTDLPPLSNGLTYGTVGVQNGEIVVTARTLATEDDLIQFYVLEQDDPGSISDAYETNGELTRFYGDVQSGVYALEYDRDAQSGWLHGFLVNPRVLDKWQVPEDKVQGLRLWRQASSGPVIGVEYVDSNGNGCASVYRFTEQTWQLLRDFCDDHSQIEISDWNLTGQTLHMTASAGTGRIIPAESSLVIIPDIRQPLKNVKVVGSSQFTGDIIDTLITHGGGYFYTKKELPVGCPLAPWECVYEGRLYHFAVGPEIGVTKVFEGFYETSLVFSGLPIISQPWPVAERILFASATPEFGTELWRSDGTEEGTYLLKDISPGQTSTVGYWFSNEAIWTAPLN